MELFWLLLDDFFEVDGIRVFLYPSAAIFKLLRFWGSMLGTFSSLFRGLDSRRLFLCVFVDSGSLQVPIGSPNGPIWSIFGPQIGED